LEDPPLPDSCLSLHVLFASLGITPLTLLSLATLGLGILLCMGQGALENLSWTRLQERAPTEKKEAALRRWLDAAGLDHIVLTFEWTRLSLYLVLLICLDRLFLSSLSQNWFIGFVAVIGLILLVGESIPRFISRYNAEAVLLSLQPVLEAIMFILLPITRLMLWLPNSIARLSGSSPEAFQHEKLTAEITDAADEGERGGVLEESEREMIKNIIDLADTRVEEVMTPRIDVISVDCNASLEEARHMAVVSGHSRIPVHEGNRDQIIGILHVKDLLKEAETGTVHSVRDLMRKALFIPENKGIAELLRELKELESHIAIVLDEYGGTAGLITMEDILEEIVGEIADEFDTAQHHASISEVSPDTLRIDAKMHIHEVHEAIGLDLPEDAGFETLGGFVFSKLGRVPEVGEIFKVNGAEFTILQADPRRVKRVEITLKPGTGEE